MRAIKKLFKKEYTMQRSAFKSKVKDLFIFRKKFEKGAQK